MGLELQAAVGEDGNRGSAGRLDPQRCREAPPGAGTARVPPSPLDATPVTGLHVS